MNAPVPAAQVLIQFLANTLVKTVEDDSSACAPSPMQETQMGSRLLTSTWHRPGLSGFKEGANRCKILVCPSCSNTLLFKLWISVSLKTSFASLFTQGCQVLCRVLWWKQWLSLKPLWELLVRKRSRGVLDLNCLGCPLSHLSVISLNALGSMCGGQNETAQSLWVIIIKSWFLLLSIQFSSWFG